jgi:coenzyme PQQ synthesis protein D (PqqD)
MSSLFRRSSSALTRSVAGEILIATPQNETVDVLAGTAAHVWSLLDRPRSVKEMARMLADLYDSPRRAIANDVERLLQELVKHGSVEVVMVDDE